MTVVDVVRARVTDGQHRWGRLTVRPVDRTLWSSRTLTVFAPGTSRRESAWLRAWHAWVVVVAAAAVVTLAATSALPAAAPRRVRGGLGRRVERPAAALAARRQGVLGSLGWSRSGVRARSARRP